jgi:hypothetical protein
MDKPRPPEETDVFTPRTAVVFIVGLVAYGLGFVLLAGDHPDLSPVVIVSGILAMVWAFLA